MHGVFNWHTFSAYNSKTTHKGVMGGGSFDGFSPRCFDLGWDWRVSEKKRVLVKR